MSSAKDVVDQLRPVEHLAVALLSEQVKDVPGILRRLRTKLLAIEQVERVEHGGPLLRLLAAGEPAQGVLGGLLPVIAGDEDREGRVVRALLLEGGGEAD